MALGSSAPCCPVPVRDGLPSLLRLLPPTRLPLPGVAVRQACVVRDSWHGPQRGGGCDRAHSVGGHGVSVTGKRDCEGVAAQKGRRHICSRHEMRATVQFSLEDCGSASLSPFHGRPPRHHLARPPPPRRRCPRRCPRPPRPARRCEPATAHAQALCVTIAT